MLSLVLVGQLRWANTMCGVAWRGVAWRSRDGPRSQRRGPTCTAQSTPLCTKPHPRVSLSGTQGRLSFAAGSSADDGSPGTWAGHRGRKNEQFGKDRPWNGSTSQVAGRTSRLEGSAESRQQRWHLLDDSPIAPPPRRAGSSAMTSRSGCAQRSMFNTHSRLRL